MNIGKDLFDIIGVLIGFVAVMLLLSLLVTGLVQSMQAIIRTRSRNLKKGIEALLNTATGISADNKKIAGNILNSEFFAIMGKQKDPNSVFSKLIGSSVSYIDPKQLPNAVHAYLKQKEDVKIEKNQITNRINELWPVLERQMEKQFISKIRYITLACAIVVAFCFQASATDILNKLSIDSNLRGKIVSEAMQISEESAGKTSLIPTYRDVSEQALIEVEKKYPELEKCENLEQFSGSGKTKHDILEEFNEVLESLKSDLPNLDLGQVSKYYEEQLDKFYQEEDARNKEQMRAAIDMLGKFNINFWQNGWSFYRNESGIQWKNIIGILVTVILLSFGAPFWYERLKDMMMFKDALSKGIKKEDEKKGSK